jgi:hypothetical protein
MFFCCSLLCSCCFCFLSYRLIYANSLIVVSSFFDWIDSSLFFSLCCGCCCCCCWDNGVDRCSGDGFDFRCRRCIFTSRCSLFTSSFLHFLFCFVLCLFIFLHSILSVFPFSIAPFSFCFGFTLGRSCTSYSKSMLPSLGPFGPLNASSSH